MKDCVTVNAKQFITVMPLITLRRNDAAENECKWVRISNLSNRHHQRVKTLIVFNGWLFVALKEDGIALPRGRWSKSHRGWKQKSRETIWRYQRTVLQMTNQQQRKGGEKLNRREALIYRQEWLAQKFWRQNGHECFMPWCTFLAILQIWRNVLAKIGR